MMIRILLPYHLRVLARCGTEVQLDIVGSVTQRSILDALEARYPMLRGTIRDQTTGKRRPLLRFLPATRICRSSRWTRRCPPRLPAAPSRSSSWERWRGEWDLED